MQGRPTGYLAWPETLESPEPREVDQLFYWRAGIRCSLGDGVKTMIRVGQ